MTMTDEARKPLTTGMRMVLIAVGAVVVVGGITAVWLLSAGASAPGAQVSESSAAHATSGPLPGATATTGSEVVSPQPGQTQTDPDRLPPLDAPTPLATAPLPPSASATGSLVDGFPETVMGPTSDADVVSSSIATQDTTMQVALVARTDSSSADVIAHYKALWEGLGLSVSATANAATAVGSFESLTLSFSSSGTGTVYSLFGVLRTG